MSWATNWDGTKYDIIFYGILARDFSSGMWVGFKGTRLLIKAFSFFFLESTFELLAETLHVHADMWFSENRGPFGT